MATRVYFPSGTFAPDVSPAFDAGWNNTGTAVRRKLVTDGTKRGTAAASVTVTGTAANPEKMLHAQYISEPLVAQTISGSIKGQFRTLESATTANATIQICVRVVSQDGGTVRATLLAAGGTTNTATTPPEFTTALTNRRLLDSGDATPLSLSSFTCRDGDRLVIEIGHNNKSTSTSQTHQISFGDNTTDLPEDDTTTTALDPWIEFSATLVFIKAADVVRISDPGTVEFMNAGWVKANDREEIAAALDLGSALFHQENPHPRDTVTAVLDLGVILSEALKLADGPPLTGAIIQASPSESLKIAEALSDTLDPEETSLSESLKIADTATMLIVLLANLQEVLHLSDTGRGIVQLLGVVHVVDTVSAALSAGTDLSTSATETFKLSESLTAIEDETASLTDSLKVADALTAARDLTASLTEALKVADTTTLLEDPEEATPSEALKVIDTAAASFNEYGQPADDVLHVVDTAAGQLDPLQVTAALAENLRPDDSDVSASRTLEAQAGPDSLKIADSISAAILIQALVSEALTLGDGPVDSSSTPIVVAVQGEALLLADAVATESGLAVVVTPEFVRESDRVIILQASLNESIKLSDSGGGATSLIGTLRIADGPVIAQVGSLLSAGPTEALRLGEELNVVRSPIDLQVADDTVKIAYVASEVEYTQDEYARVGEVLTAALTTGGDLSTNPQDETLRIAETLALARTLEVAVASEIAKLADTVGATRTLTLVVATENLKLADGPAAVARDIESTPAEALKVADTLTAVVDAEATAAEALRISEELVAIIGMVVVSTETLLLADTVTAQADAVATPAEALRVAEILAASVDLIATATEALKVADTVTTKLDALEATPGETLKLADGQVFVSFTDAGVIATAVVEQLAIADTPVGGLDPEQASAAESLKISDAASSILDLYVAVAAEALKVADTLTAVRDLTASLTENLSVVDIASSVAGLFAVISEALRIGETKTVIEDLNASVETLVPMREDFDIGFGQPLDGTIATASVKVADHVAASITPLLAPLDSEDVMVGDAHDQTLAIPVVVAEENLHVGDDGLLQLGLDLAAVIDTGGVPTPTHVIGPLIASDDTTLTLVASADNTIRMRARTN